MDIAELITNVLATPEAHALAQHPELSDMIKTGKASAFFDRLQSTVAANLMPTTDLMGVRERAAYKDATGEDISGSAETMPQRNKLPAPEQEKQLNSYYPPTDDSGKDSVDPKEVLQYMLRREKEQAEFKKLQEGLAQKAKADKDAAEIRHQNALKVMQQMQKLQ